jgi:hypothetical protein
MRAKAKYLTGLLEKVANAKTMDELDIVRRELYDHEDDLERIDELFNDKILEIERKEQGQLLGEMNGIEIDWKDLLKDIEDDILTELEDGDIELFDDKEKYLKYAPIRLVLESLLGFAHDVIVDAEEQYNGKSVLKQELKDILETIRNENGVY